MNKVVLNQNAYTKQSDGSFQLTLLLLFLLHTEHRRSNRRRRKQAFVPGLWLWTSQPQTHEAAEERVQPCSDTVLTRTPRKESSARCRRHKQDLHQPPSSLPPENLGKFFDLWVPPFPRRWMGETPALVKIQLVTNILYEQIDKESRKRYWWTCLQGRNRTHVKNSRGKRRGQAERAALIYIRVSSAQSTQDYLSFLSQ